MSSQKRLAVPLQLREQVLMENHDAVYGRHFSVKKMIKS